MIIFAAWLYIVLVLGTVAFQLALIAGAPWGHLTQGGRHKGRLPLRSRMAASVSIIVLLCMGTAIATIAGLAPSMPSWVGWLTVGVQALSTMANWATPSVSERRLWGPINTVMLAAALCVFAQV